jgi:cell division septum initiation protein DivIVA
MAKIKALPPIPGVRDLQTLMAFIMNKEEYEARLEALVSLQEEIHTLMGKVDKAQDIDALLSSAMSKDVEASATLERVRLKAKQEAMEIVQNATEEADRKLSEAERIYQETVVKMSQVTMRTGALASGARGRSG